MTSQSADRFAERQEKRTQAFYKEKEAAFKEEWEKWQREEEYKMMKRWEYAIEHKMNGIPPEHHYLYESIPEPRPTPS